MAELLLAGFSVPIVIYAALPVVIPIPVLLLLIFGGWTAALGVPVVVFWILSIPMLDRSPCLPMSSRLLFTTAAFLEVLYWPAVWQDGLKWRSLEALLFYVTMNATVILVLSSMAHTSTDRPSFGKSLAFHWMLVVWLFTIAFPYVGELI